MRTTTVVLLSVARFLPGAFSQEALGLDGQAEIMCTENLIANRGFEDGTTGWSASAGDVTLDNDVVYNGKASLRMDAPPAPQWELVSPARVPVEPGVRYRLHFFHRSEAVHVGPAWRVYPIESSRRMTRGRAAWGACDGATDWAGYFCDYIFPTDVAEVEIVFVGGWWREELDRDATYWLDDVEFGPAEELDYGELSDVNAESIIPNGGFECGYDGQSFGWTVTQNIGQATGRFGPRGASLHVPESNVTWDTDAYRGERCLRITYTGDDQHHVRVGRTLLPEEGVEYEIRFYARSEGQAGRVNFAAFGADGLTPGLACEARVRSDEWQRYELRYTPDEDTPVPSGLRIAIAQVGPGSLWIDEIEMVPAE